MYICIREEIDLNSHHKIRMYNTPKRLVCFSLFKSLLTLAETTILVCLMPTLVLVGYLFCTVPYQKILNMISFINKFTRALSSCKIEYFFRFFQARELTSGVRSHK